MLLIASSIQNGGGNAAAAGVVIEVRFLAEVAESVRIVYYLAIAIFSIRVRISVKSRRLSLFAAMASLLGFRQFPARSPRCGPQPAVFNGFGPDPGTAGEIFPAIREFAASLAFATMRRQ
jgi:hypothetical protein